MAGPAEWRAQFRRLPWWKKAGAVLGALALAGLVAAYLGFRVLLATWGKDLPDITWAENYRPPIVSDVLSGDDQLLGEFYAERRRVVPYDRIPKKLVQAFIAAEDSNFFDHGGFDVVGIIRATVQNIAKGRRASGASTLTQQTAKAILISTWGFERATAKTFQRKFCELLLARELESRFTKEEILFLYLNQVYLGHSSYGVQAAAENYFRKNAWDLTLGEMSLLAGLPQAPSKYSPFKHPERAKNRRVYVLGRMLVEGMITKAEHDAAKVEDVVVYPVEDFFRETAPFVTEHVRRDILDRYTNQRLLNDGLKIYATVDLDLEREAIAATLRGLQNADKRQGFHGLCVRYDTVGRCQEIAKLVGTGKPGSKEYESSLAKEIAGFRKLQREKGAAPDTAEGLQPDRDYVAVVLDADKNGLTVGVGDRIEARVPVQLLGWARKPDALVNVKYAPPVNDATIVAKPGDLALVKLPGEKDEELLADLRPKAGKKVKQTITKKVKKKRKGKVIEVEVEETVWVDPPADAGTGPLLLALDQEIELQASLVALDPKSGYVVAMIGGSDFDKSEFNRAFQACRQPGSSFKPVYYSAALSGHVRAEHRCKHPSMNEEAKLACEVESCQKLRGAWVPDEKRCYFTPATPLLDAPIVYDDDVNATRWKPQNFEEQFLGDVPLREALVNSMNIPAVKVLEAVGVNEAAAWARHLGISTAPKSPDLSLALGSACVYMWDLVRVYAMFNRLGERVKATFIRRVVDRDGNILEDHSAPTDPWIGLRSRLASGYAKLFEEHERVIDPASAYVVTDLLRQVASRGTAASAQRLGREVAGKTGTTNDAFDTWFMGFSPELVAGVWIGYDTAQNRDPMGKFETGGTTSLPIWIEFMQAALKGRPQREFERPEGVVSVGIDKATGARVESGGVAQVFKAGTEPTMAAAAQQQMQNQTGDFFRSQDF